MRNATNNTLISNQIKQEHEETKIAVQEFLEQEGPELQAKLNTYATDKSSYIEEFWYVILPHKTNLKKIYCCTKPNIIPNFFPGMTLTFNTLILLYST